MRDFVRMKLIAISCKHGKKDFKDPARDKDEEIITGGNDFMQNWRENDFMQNHANTI